MRATFFSMTTHFSENWSSIWTACYIWDYTDTNWN